MTIVEPAGGHIADKPRRPGAVAGLPGVPLSALCPNGSPMMNAELGMLSREAPSSGQALVEFSMTIAVFLLLVFGAVTASVYTVERGAAVTGVAAGARVAVGGTGGPSGENTPNLAGASPAVVRVAGPLL